MERRRFLGAAAALAALPAAAGVTDADQDLGDVATELDQDLGVGKAEGPTREGFWSSVEFQEWDNDDAEVWVNSTWYDRGDPAHVDLRVSTYPVSLGVSMDPDRALEVAEDLRRVALLAKRGDEQLGVDR